jgi:glycosyltransferase involved in cell wall biosynthesis
MPDPSVSIVIPVKDGGEDLRCCLEAIARQDGVPFELVVVDSGSTDGSDELALAHGAHLERIAPDTFNHGSSRNLGARLARGDVLVFTSQDAYAVGRDWLARLIAPLAAENVAGVYGRQLAHEDAHPPERYFMDFLYGPRARVQAAFGRDELTMDTTMFSNANAAIRRSAWERFPFADDIVMSEDQEWACRALLAGYRLVYEPEAVVRHSHPYTVATAFRRFFDSGASAERAYLSAARPGARALRRRALRYGTDELAWLWTTNQRRWIPYTAVYELAKFAGLQLGVRHRRLPLWLKLRASALPDYWRAADGGGRP